MRIFNLNVNNFGGPYDKKPQKRKEESWGEYREARCEFEKKSLDVLRDIISTIDAEKPDIIVFQEFDVNAPAGEKAARLLAERGYERVYPNRESEISGSFSITIIFVKELEIVPCASPKILEYRWCAIKIGDLTIMGVHAPLESNRRKAEEVQRFFDELKVYAEKQQNEKLMILGDMNVHSGKLCSYFATFDDIRKDVTKGGLGYCDKVVDEEITHFPTGHTLDHVLVSPALKDKVTADVKKKSEYELSDHAVIIVDIKE